MSKDKKLLFKKIALIIAIASVLKAFILLFMEYFPAEEKKSPKVNLIRCVEIQNRCVRLIQSQEKSDNLSYLCEKMFDYCKIGCTPKN